MSEPLSYNTIAAPATSLFKDRGSKFLGFAFPVNDVDEVKAHLKSLKEAHPKAVHHCYAYRLGVTKNDFRANDDGEPSGSAGKPILGQIDSAGLTHVLVVVVRYFGGTLLGVPGLIHAYKTATAEALQQVAHIEKKVTRHIALEFDYNKLSEVRYVLEKHEAEIVRQELQLFCRLTAAVPLSFYDALYAKLALQPSIKIIENE